jgi:hypothetical protein
MSIARYLAKPAKTTTTFPSVSTTVFTVTGGYTIGQLDVFLNGVRLVSGSDYTATDGTSFTLTAASAVSGDVVQHTVYPTSPLSFLSTGGGTVTGTVTLTSALNPTAGIKFPATPSLSADVNTLDDYEEGTFTPTFTATTTSPTVTYNAITYGAYVKIGRLVFINLRISVATLPAAGSGNIRISGLPFSSNATDAYGQLSIGYRGGWTTTAPTYAYTEAAQTFLNLGTVSGGGLVATTQANLSATVDVMISGFYTTTS